jgi:hypothetical protein
VAFRPREGSLEPGVLARGEMLQTLSDDEGVAGEDDREVVLPTAETPPFVVVVAQFAFHLRAGGFVTFSTP